MKNFDDSIKEWESLDRYYDNDCRVCECGQSIKEICIIQNKYNQNMLEIGNCCVNYFLNDFSNNVYFKDYQRILKNKKSTILKNESLYMLYELGAISEIALDQYIFNIKEHDYLVDEVSSIFIKIIEKTITKNDIFWDNIKIKLKYEK